MASSPVTMTFDEETFPNAQDRVAAWRDAFSMTVDVRFENEEIEYFTASYCYHSLGSVLLVERSYTKHTVIRSKDTILRTGTGQLIFHYFLSGGMVGTAGGERVVVNTGDCFMYDMRGTLCIDMLAGSFIGLIMPRFLFQEEAGYSNKLHGLVHPADSAEVAYLGPMLIGLSQQAERLDDVSRQALGAALIRLVAASFAKLLEWPRGARPGVRPASRVPVATQADLSTKLRRHIYRHAADPTYNPDALALAFEMSRATLYRVLGSEGGVAEAIRRRRAALALQALTDRPALGLSLEELARACGFHNVGALRRALRQVYGASPSELQARASKRGMKQYVSSAAIGALFDELPS